MLDIEGPLETARQGDNMDHVVDERKIHQVVDGLGQCKVSVAVIQVTQWFGEAEYKVGESLELAAGMAVPGAGPVRQRGESVAIVLAVWPCHGCVEHGAPGWSWLL